MGRAPIICKHGIRGIANCKDCQREQHTERVRELRRQKRELEEQEHALEKEHMQENTFIDAHSVQQSGKATGREFFKSSGSPEPSMVEHMAKEIPVSCGSCARLYVSCPDSKSLYYRIHQTACKNYVPRRGEKHE